MGKLVLENCIRHNRRIYCWNPDKEKVEEILMIEREFDECPRSVIARMINSRSKSRTKIEVLSQEDINDLLKAVNTEEKQDGQD